MSEALSALPGAVFEGAARVMEAGPRGMITVRGDLSLSSLKSVCTGIAAVDFPDVGEANCVGQKGLCWMSPDELLVLCPYGEAEAGVAKIDKALSRTHHLAVNVSDARALFYVEGPASRDVMAKLTPADLHPGAFRTGQFRRTRLAQVPAAFWMRDDETFEVICFRSVASYVFDILRASADPDGEVGYL